jgi:tRNA-intron endonuclease
MPVLVENKVIVSEQKLRDQLIQKGFGERKEKELVLDLWETAFLIEKKKITVKDTKGKSIKEKKILGLGEKKDRRFYSKLIAYKDLRERGYCVRTGFKFGFDFRVYPKGKNPGEAHSQWCVDVKTQEEKFSMQQLSRAVRLAQNLHTLVIIAIVDSENEINYYELKRLVP